jgi:hypothetical protein
MDRLFRRRKAQPAPEPPSERIHVYARGMEISGWVQPSGERITDILRHGGELAFLPDGADAADPDSWLSLVSDSVLIVVPPPHVSPPERRLRRQTQRVRVRVGQYDVTGTAHLRPGFEQDLLLRATQPFLPLTDATLATDGRPGTQSHDVVIVNLAEVQEITEI